MYSIIAQTVEGADWASGWTAIAQNPLVIMGGMAAFVLVFVVLLFCYLFYRRRVEHRQVMAAVERGMEPGGLGMNKVPGLVWITRLTIGVGLLIIGIGVVVWGRYAGVFMLAGIALSGVGVALVLYGLLRRGAENRAWAIEKGVPLSEIERPNPIMSLWMGAGLVVLLLPLFIVLQNESNTMSVLLFSICSAGAVGLLVRGCLLRRAERRYLTKEKGIRFSGRRRSRITKSILLGIGFLLLSLFFLYMVVEEFVEGRHPDAQYLIFFTVPFTLGVVFFVRAALVRRRRRERSTSGQVDTEESKTVSD